MENIRTESNIIDLERRRQKLQEINKTVTKSLQEGLEKLGPDEETAYQVKCQLYEEMLAQLVHAYKKYSNCGYTCYDRKNKSMIVACGPTETELVQRTRPPSPQQQAHFSKKNWEALRAQQHKERERWSVLDTPRNDFGDALRNISFVE